MFDLNQLSDEQGIRLVLLTIMVAARRAGGQFGEAPTLVAKASADVDEILKTVSPPAAPAESAEVKS